MLLSSQLKPPTPTPQHLRSIPPSSALALQALPSALCLPSLVLLSTHTSQGKPSQGLLKASVTSEHWKVPDHPVPFPGLVLSRNINHVCS